MAACLRGRGQYVQPCRGDGVGGRADSAEGGGAGRSEGWAGPDRLSWGRRPP